MNEYKHKKSLETKERALKVLKAYEDDQQQHIFGSGMWALVGVGAIGVGVATKKSEPGLSYVMHATAALFLLYAVFSALYYRNNKSEAKELEKSISS